MKPDPAPPPERVIRTSGYWRRTFENNARSLREIPWWAGAELTAEETRDVAASLRGFQRGESSTGSRLVRYARAYARRTGDVEYVLAIRLFIAEEQRHARDLGRFLELNGIPLAAANPLDRVFRGLRHALGTLEVAVTVLLTAEIVATVYYEALRAATRSSVLRALCDQILDDEARHVEFQAEHLGKLQAERGASGLNLTNRARRVLLRGTCVAVWMFHRGVLERAGLTFREFRRRCGDEFELSLKTTLEVRDAVRFRSAVTRLLGTAT